nr:S24 family peptidase [Pyrinomonadaceae bacterium]
IKHPIATFYIRVAGDSMSGAGIDAGDILIVDRAAEASDGHVVVARINDELCVKQLCTGDDGRVCLLSANDRYVRILMMVNGDYGEREHAPAGQTLVGSIYS